MDQEYTLLQMIGHVADFFKAQGFRTEQYNELLYNVRLPLYCVRKGKAREEIVVDVITEDHISKNTYMPNKHLGDRFVPDASTVKFFQYYLPKAKVYWAYGHYVKSTKDFDEFKKACHNNGIGLLRVSDNQVTIVQESTPLNVIISQRIQAALADEPGMNRGIISKVSAIINEHQKEYIQYLVIYGEPSFSRRAITDRKDDLGLSLSMLLINKLESVRNLVYGDNLKKFTRNYRYEKENDHQIAFKLINALWERRFKTTYPDIHKDFETVLMLDRGYRDHFLHQFQVFILGALIIDTLYHEQWVKDFEKHYHSKIEDAWLACATYHDYNYPVQRWDGWMKIFIEQNFHISKVSAERHIGIHDVESQVARLNPGEIVIRDEFIAKMQRLCMEIGCKLDDRFQRFILRRVAIDKNHAVLAAFTFVEKFQGATNLSDTAISAVATSILLHDESNWQCLRGNTIALLECTNRKEGQITNEEKSICSSPLIGELSLNGGPLNFLLAYCDVAQEWGRKGGNSEVMQPLLEDIQIDIKRILVHVSVLDDNSFGIKEKEIRRLGAYLNDPRFELTLTSREGKGNYSKPMNGK
ncbi:MAG: hypothetical protein PHO26_04130 [Dehalococcoidia bacterium]|nr:hypothetical protein [Dehalococcoidia bacterium]MDD5493189.1 hypothetical protein [Dehalococcoidia bacterium]